MKNAIFLLLASLLGSSGFSANLQGIRIAASDHPAPAATEEGVVIEGLNLAEAQETELKEMLGVEFLGRPIDEPLVQAIKATIRNYYRTIKKTVFILQAPQQELTDGTLVLQVAESRAGTVQVMGEKWFSEKTYSRAISLKQGDPVRIDRLVSDLAWLNRNPFRQVNALFRPGESQNTTDVDLIVQDRFPLRVYSGLDNSGFLETDPQQFFVGLNWGNAFMLDHVLSYQFTASLDFKKLQAHTLDYLAPLSWRHIFHAYGAYSNVDAHLRASARTEGTSSQLSGRYLIPFGARDNLLQEFRAGIDFKRTNNNLTFGGTTISNRYAQILQFVGGYDLTYSAKWYRLFFDIDLFWSPGHLTGDQKNIDYESLRPFTESQYLYGRATLQQTFSIPRDFRVNLLFRGQAASRNLLPSEQFGLGGYYSVRGYLEREVNVDNAFLASIEVETPKVHLLSLSPSVRKRFTDDLWFLGFIDYGFGAEHRRTPGEKNTYNLLGAGPAARYNIGPWVTFRADWGFQILHTGLSGRWMNLNFMLLVAY